jgi:ATP-binding cassette, subfamily F, member 3
MRSKDILKAALNQYNGTMILVSHDREFLDGLCNKVIEFKEGYTKEFPGGIFEFLQSRKLETLKSLEQKAEKVVKKEEPKPKTNEANQAITKEMKQVQTQIRTCEENIANLEKQVLDLENKLADTELYSNQEESAKFLSKYDSTKAELAKQMEKWENLLLKQEEFSSN